MHLRLLVCLSSLIAGCGGGVIFPDAPSPDAPLGDTPITDAGPLDAPVIPLDAGADGGPGDAGRADAGPPRCASTSCSMRGACTDGPRGPECACDPGYAGPACERCAAGFQDNDADGRCARGCDAATCSGHGTCSDATGATACTCSGGYTGADCSGCEPGAQDRDGDGVCAPACGETTCSGEGSCDDASGAATCTCDIDRDGAACERCASGLQDRDGDGTCTPACEAASCTGHGTCDDVSGTALCTCQTGYDGSACGTCAAGFQDNDGDGTCAPTCDASRCDVHGACDDASGAALCVCEPGYAGARCDACAAGFQDNDENGTCAPSCAIAGCPSTCEDVSGAAVCTCTPACGAGGYCNGGSCAPIFTDISGATSNASFAPRVSSDGLRVAFHSQGAPPGIADTNGRRDVFVYDASAGTFEILSRPSALVEGDGESVSCDASDDLRVVAWISSATNLAASDANGIAGDAFVFDRATGTRLHVSEGIEATAAADAVAVDPSGRWILFRSNSRTLFPDGNGQYQAVLYDRTLDVYETASRGHDGTVSAANVQIGGVSDGGRFVVFSSGAALVPEDTNGVEDVFVRDRMTGTTRRVSVSSTGTQSNGGSSLPVISGDGLWVAFQSTASNLVAGDTNGLLDAFAHDLATGTTVRVSVGPSGERNAGGLALGDLSSDGRMVSFSSGSTNLHPTDPNGANDVFVFDLTLGTLRTVSSDVTGVIGTAASDNARLSADGRWVVFNTRATNLVVGAGGVNDIVMRDLAGP